MNIVKIANNKIIKKNTSSYYEYGIKYPIIKIEVSDEIYQAYLEDIRKIIYQDDQVILNPDYEEIKQKEKRQELDQLTLTPADVERALYKAKGIDFEDLKALIAEKLPDIDIKALAIEFRAKDFYRGAMAGGVRLFDVVGALLGYSPEDMDYLFENKELPNN